MALDRGGRNSSPLQREYTFLVDAVAINKAGKVALVTGGGCGMGRSTALRFAQCGATVVVADIDSQSGSDTVGVIEEKAGNRPSHMSTSAILRVHLRW